MLENYYTNVLLVTKCWVSLTQCPIPLPYQSVNVHHSLSLVLTLLEHYKSEMEGMKGKCMHICLYTCMFTSAVHLEIAYVQDFIVEGFLLAFRRFSSRKSLPGKMLSDNASIHLPCSSGLSLIHSKKP